MLTRLRVLAVVFLLLSSCDSSGSPTTVSAPSRTCTEPPVVERNLKSWVDLTVEPNPVQAGADAILAISDDGLPAETIVGAGATWKCWNGTEWIITHQIVKGHVDGPVRTQEVEPGATTTIMAVGLPIPRSDPILIPDVAPGTYRIEDRVLRPGGAEITGFVLVEVVGSD